MGLTNFMSGRENAALWACEKLRFRVNCPMLPMLKRCKKSLDCQGVSGTIETVADKLRKLKIPCDAIHLDAAWEKSFKHRECNAFDYEWDEEAFPSPEEMVHNLRSKGFKLCLATNPYINEEVWTK